ncbi:MAG: hypothetical protein HOO96_07955 [Polyangiaceae bacterium]|nr:hypothetical protein [Polyangiaceae bacterium]
MKLLRTTQLLVVPAIEPLLPIWCERLGYAVLDEVPLRPGGPLGFTLLAQGDHHLMLQTEASLEEDLPAIAALRPTSLLYNRVASLDDAMAAMAPATPLVGPRTTFYGAREAFFVLPAGHVVGFAEHTPG